MKIGFDTRALMGRMWFSQPTGSSAAPAGVAGYVFNILKNLAELDQENEYFLFFNSFKKPDTRPLDGILQKPNVNLVNFRYPNKIFDRTARFLNQPKIDRLLGGVDVYFSPHFNITPLTRSTRQVVTIHDLSFEIYPEFFPWRKRFWHWSQNIKAACLRADKIIAVSENTRADLIQIYHVNPDKIEVVYSGTMNQQATTKTSSHLLKKYNLPDEYILYLGTLEPRKNLETLIQAFTDLKNNISLDLQIPLADGRTKMEIKILRDVNLVLAGGKGWHYKRILKQAIHSKFSQQIHILGYVPEADKAALIQAASVCVCPSYYEGFGFPPLEALSQGTPVIASHNSSLGEIVGMAGLLVDPYNVHDLSQAMAEVLSNQRLKPRFIKKSQSVFDKFSWSRAAQQTLNVLKAAGNLV